MKAPSASGRLMLLLLGDAALSRRIESAAAPGCDVRTVASASAAREALATHAGPALLLVSEPTARSVPALKAEYPRVHAVLLTREPALLRAARELPLRDLGGVLAANLPARRLRSALAEALEQAQRGASTAYAADPAAPPTELQDAPGQWPRVGGQRGIDLRRDWLKVLVHDLRTPLGISNGFATLLLERDSALPEEAREVLGRIHSNGQWMMQFLDGILDLAELEQGSAVLRYGPTPLRELLESVAERMRGLADPQGVRIAFAIAPGPQTHLIDRVRVEQVLHNLLSNAVRVSGPGSTVHIDVRPERERLAFEVRDEGRGMTPEEAARAFDLFASRSGGRGLGLTIAKAIVEVHGGRIGCDCVPGRGCTFHFTIVPGPAGD